MGEVLITGGRIIAGEDIDALKKIGMGELFPPGTSTNAIGN